MKALYGYIAAGSLAFAVVTGLGGYVHGVKVQKGRAAAEELRLVAVEERAAKAAAVEIAKLRIVHQTTTQVLEREIVNNPLPDTCRLSDDGLRALNAILAGQPFGAGDRELPGADAAP